MERLKYPLLIQEQTGIDLAEDAIWEELGEYGLKDRHRAVLLAGLAIEPNTIRLSALFNVSRSYINNILNESYGVLGTSGLPETYSKVLSDVEYMTGCATSILRSYGKPSQYIRRLTGLSICDEDKTNIEIASYKLASRPPVTLDPREAAAVLRYQDKDLGRGAYKPSVANTVGRLAFCLAANGLVLQDEPDYEVFEALTSGIHTPVEIQMIALFEKGVTPSTDVIGRVRGVSPLTVESQLQTLYRVYGTSSLAELIIALYRFGTIHIRREEFTPTKDLS